MATVINASYSTLIGTPGQLQAFIERMKGKGASIVNLQFSNFVVLDKPLDNAVIGRALESTPRRQR